MPLACLLVRNITRQGVKDYYKILYYKFINKIANIELINNTTGNGLYDRKIINALKTFKDHDPYFRGFISDLGYPVKKVFYNEQKRVKGKSKNNFYTLYEEVMRGFVSHSIIPLRLMGILGVIISFASISAGVYYFIKKNF